MVATSSVFIGDSQVENVDRSKYLGVIIDRSLTWEEHINILCTKVTRAIGFFEICEKIFTAKHIK